jgi:hypothetical protein
MYTLIKHNINIERRLKNNTPNDFERVKLIDSIVELDLLII